MTKRLIAAAEQVLAAWNEIVQPSRYGYKAVHDGMSELHAAVQEAKRSRTSEPEIPDRGDPVPTIEHQQV